MPDRTATVIEAENNLEKIIKLKKSSVTVSSGIYIISIPVADGGKKYIKLPLHLKNIIQDSLKNYKIKTLIAPVLYNSRTVIQIWYNRLRPRFKQVLGNGIKPDYEKVKLFFIDLEEVCYNSTLFDNDYGVTKLLMKWFEDYIDPLSKDPTSTLRHDLVKCCDELYWLSGTRIDYLTNKMASRKSAYNGFLKTKKVEGEIFYAFNNKWFESILPQYLMVINLPKNSKERKFNLNELKFENEIKR